jgi:hypothetical protein
MSLSRLRCFLIGHRWLRVPYDGADASDGFFLRCRRCATENHRESSGVHPAIAWGWRPYT